MTVQGEARRARLAAARLYFVTDTQPGGREVSTVLRQALSGGVDVVQLRDKALGDDELLTAAAVFRACCDEAGALFMVNDRPDLALAAGADGVHVGQDDMAPEAARAIVGSDRIVGRSTHSPAQVDAATEVDYIAVGPVHATPTKPGRPAAGLDPIRHAATHARVPWFAIGGLHAGNLDGVIRAGARRIVVVRAIAQADDPAGTARALRCALDATREEAGVGPA